MREFRILPLALTLALAACGEQGGAGGQPVSQQQTHFPGMVTAGGNTSGEVMKQSGEKVGASMPAGTPGTPRGMEGNTGGTALGGTTPGGAVAGEAPKGAMAGERKIEGEPSASKGTTGPAAPTAGSGTERAQAGTATPQQAIPGQPTPAGQEKPSANPAPAAKPDAAAQAEKAKQELAASMDQVASSWRAAAAKHGWPTHAPTPVAPAAGIAASAAQQGGASPPPVKSEKSGTAPASEDVKRPKPPGAR
jgi:predicted small lipoprotein YifL